MKSPNICSNRYVIGGEMALAALALTGCAVLGGSGSNYVAGEMANPNANSTEVTLADGRRVGLADGTQITSSCLKSGAPFILHATVESGPYDGATADIPRADVAHKPGTADPFKADEQHPRQDAFGPLDLCSEVAH